MSLNLSVGDFLPFLQERFGVAKDIFAVEGFKNFEGILFFSIFNRLNYSATLLCECLIPSN